MRLKNWNIGDETINGYVSGSSKYPDGTFVETSRVMAAAYDGELYLISTQNSTYECYEKDYAGDPEKLLIFARTMVEDRSGTREINLNLRNR